MRHQDLMRRVSLRDTLFNLISWYLMNVPKSQNTDFQKIVTNQKKKKKGEECGWWKSSKSPDPPFPQTVWKNPFLWSRKAGEDPPPKSTTHKKITNEKPSKFQLRGMRLWSDLGCDEATGHHLLPGFLIKATRRNQVAPCYDCVQRHADCFWQVLGSRASPLFSLC